MTILVDVMWYLTVVLVYISHRVMMLNTVSCAYQPWVCPVWKKISSDLLPVLFGLFVYFLLSYRVLYVGHKFLLRYMFCKYFLLFCGLFCYFLWWYTFKYNNLKFWWSLSLSVFSVVACAFGVISKWPNSRLWRFTPMFVYLFFFSVSFIVLVLTFRSLVHTELIFVYDLT